MNVTKLHSRNVASNIYFIFLTLVFCSPTSSYGNVSPSQNLTLHISGGGGGSEKTESQNSQEFEGGGGPELSGQSQNLTGSQGRKNPKMHGMLGGATVISQSPLSNTRNKAVLSCTDKKFSPAAPEIKWLPRHTKLQSASHCLPRRTSRWCLIPLITRYF